MEFVLVMTLVELVDNFPLVFLFIVYFFCAFISTLVAGDWAKAKDSHIVWRSKHFRAFLFFGWIIFWPCYGVYRLVNDIILDGTS